MFGVKNFHSNITDHQPLVIIFRLKTGLPLSPDKDAKVVFNFSGLPVQDWVKKFTENV